MTRTVVSAENAAVVEEENEVESDTGEKKVVKGEVVKADEQKAVEPAMIRLIKVRETATVAKDDTQKIVLARTTPIAEAAAAKADTTGSIGRAAVEETKTAALDMGRSTAEAVGITGTGTAVEKTTMTAAGIRVLKGKRIMKSAAAAVIDIQRTIAGEKAEATDAVTGRR